MADRERIGGLTQEHWARDIDAHLAKLGVTLYGSARLVTEGTGRQETAEAFAKLLFDVARGTDPKKAVQAESERQRDGLAGRVPVRPDVYPHPFPTYG